LTFIENIATEAKDVNDILLTFR